MTVWQVIVLVVCLYLLASLGPWLALQVLLWRRQAGETTEGLAQRRRELGAILDVQETLWPPAPRSGRYDPIDRRARGHLADLRRVIGDAEAQWPIMEEHARAASHVALAPAQVALLGAWQPLWAEIAFSRTVRAMALRLDEGDEAVRDLQQLEHAIATIPQRMQAELRNHRAELERLSALLEAEAEFGTAELEGPAARLREIRGAVDAALEALEQTHETALPEAAAEIDARLDQIDNDLADLDRAIGEVALARGAAQGALVRLAERLQAAAERWREMSATGLTEPTIPQALTYLEGERGRLDRLVRQRTADAYRQAAAAAGTLDEQMGALDAELDALSDLEGRLRQAVEGDVQALADALARCDELAAGRPAIEPDLSRERIAEASERYRQAEAGRQQGTRADLEAGLELAAQARATLESAVADLDPLAETAAAAMQLLAALSPDALAEWADRLSVARTALQKYGRHWDADLSARATAAASSLEQAGNVLAGLPADIRQGHVWRQSELPAILAAATTARDALVAAAEDVETLESERERLDGLAEALSTSLERLQSQLLPALRQRQATMLPELQQHMQRIEAGLATQLEVLADPAQVDYDEAVERWLPSLSRQLAEIDEAHAEDIRAYRRLMRDTVADIDRRWARLVRLSPYERPGPEEDVEALAGDLDLWRSDVDAHPDDPLTLRDLLGQRATALQIRIEAAQTQIVEGRRNLGALDRQYTRSADAARATRGRVREAQHASGWSNIAWDTEAADQAWDRALSHERESQAALTLTAAAHEMQQALAAARDAEGIYDRIEGQLRTALRRLSDEQRAVEAHIERLRRSAQEANEQGQADEAAGIEAVLTTVAGHMQASREATTVDGALRYLRDARSTLGRA